MTNSVNTNYGALVALQSLNRTNAELGSVQKRVTTGYRVNDAVDDGAAFAVAQGIRSNIGAIGAVNQQLNIGKGTVDVVVTEGFAGNIALKTAEGTAKQLAAYLRSAMSRTLMARIGYLFARGAFDALREKMDPRKVNGGVFLGLDGIVIKSHGGTDPTGFAAAIDLGYDMVEHDLMSKIRESLESNFPPPPAGAPEAETAS